MAGPRLLAEEGSELLGDLHYLRDEYSFMFVTADDLAFAERCPAGRTSVLIQNLQLEVGLPRQELLFAWGLHPYTTWREEDLEPPQALPGVVRILDPHDLESGTSIEADDRWDWTSAWDPRRRWLRIAPAAQDGSAAVEIATGVVLTLDAGVLRSVWLHPAVIGD